MKIYSSAFIPDVPLVADNCLTALWIRIVRISADNPARRFGCYRTASSDLNKEFLFRTGMAFVFLAAPWFAPSLTHCVGCIGVLVITFSWVTWNYGLLCEFRLNCLSHHQGSTHKGIHFFYSATAQIGPRPPRF